MTLRGAFGVSGVAGSLGGLIAFRLVSFRPAYAWFALIGMAAAFVLAFLVALAWRSRRFLVPGVVAAFIAGVLLFMPVACVGGADGASDWRCVNVLGLVMPGYSGTGETSWSPWPAVVAGTLAAACVYAFVSRRRSNPPAQPG